MFGKQKQALQTSLSFRFLRWIIPLVTVSFVAFGVAGFFVTRASLVSFSQQSSTLLTDQTRVALVNWIHDQIYLAQSIAANPKVVHACLNPTDDKARAEARAYLQGIHDRYQYYENVPVGIRLPEGQSLTIDYEGQQKVVRNGGFFLDTVQGRTLGKASLDLNYVRAMFDGAPYYVSHVYPSLLRGNPLFVVAAPVKSDGRVIGYALVAPRMDYFTDLFLDKVKIGDSGYLMMFDENRQVVAHPDKRLILNDKEKEKVAQLTHRILDGADQSFFETYEDVEKLYVVSRLTKNTFDPPGAAAGSAHLMANDWYIVSGQPKSEIVRASTTQVYSYLGFSILLSVFLGALLYRHTTRTITQPLLELTRAAGEIVRSGDLTQKIDAHSNDEIGELSRTFNQMVDRLREMASSLRQSLASLVEAVTNLEATNADQRETITRQAAALQETQVTAQEIKQTSNMAAQKAEVVLKVASEADEIGRSGETSIEQTLTWLADIRTEASDISTKIGELGARTRQIGHITQSVRDLADQSNMLALNAAIEAVRSGEHGKGFGVVAREIRSLADQSIQATHRVSDVLDDTANAITSTIAISEKGAQKIDSGLTQVRTSGETLRRLSNIVRENSAAVRQIAAAVSQQDAGIAQIFGSVTELSKAVDDTVKRVETTDRATEAVKSVTAQVEGIIKEYRV
ncbi:methyl-accepting chemotaxis protein [Anaeromyxobacter sp. PSR-1]|uniref:methyl-accepting chemotaxis protein n=1 Tax=Anaeromyxobacter sp. PSR-1 TaxID=1300915 RepID=UPI0005E769DA|nr:methyl-accepting chemotaxis protein [Anaeromyxobacter sp. PSR-1]GAO01163.1 methyl-accepting chemotaxis protein PctC [Anaeromyxobacter sp. PSR-1]